MIRLNLGLNILRERRGRSCAESGPGNCAARLLSARSSVARVSARTRVLTGGPDSAPTHAPNDLCAEGVPLLRREFLRATYLANPGLDPGALRLPGLRWLMHERSSPLCSFIGL